MSTKKISYYEVQQSGFKDLKRIYKLNDQQLENTVRRHLDGATPAERRQVYETVWNHKTKY